MTPSFGWPNLALAALLVFGGAFILFVWLSSLGGDE